MHILRLLQLSNTSPTWAAFYVTALAGAASAVLIALINIAAERTVYLEPIGLKIILLYLIAFSIFLIANRASLQGANRFLQNRLGLLRLRIADKIQQADLRTLENIGHGNIYATLAQETNHLSHHFSLLASAAQSLVLLLFCLIYIAFLSAAAFIVVTVATAIALIFFWRRRQAMNEAMVAVHAHESNMLDTLQHYTDGFQEIRIHADKNDALHTRFKHVVDDLERVVVGIGAKWVVLLLFSNAFLYALVGVVVFVLPLFFDGYTDTIYKIVAASVFLVGPVAAITSAAPLFAKANIGLGHVFELERRLDEGNPSPHPFPDQEAAAFRDFKTITLDGIQFSYRDTDNTNIFTTGPWTLDLQRGERVFLLGGNGSGKSTALKLISGLYSADSGRIRVDDTVVTEDLRPAYRSLFSCIFPDFHLFDRLYGFEDIDPKKVEDLIAWMQLEDKVSYAQGRFSTQDLSTGQRKRLAMIVSLLEDREIYLFDEWAADQDAYFREIFYTKILDKLKAQGKTVLVVTHDDRYWHLSDRTITLDIGAMVAGETSSPQSAGDE